MELAWLLRAANGAKIHFGHYEVQPLVQLSVFFLMELDLINRRDRGAWVWSEKHLHQLAYYLTTPYWDCEEDGKGYVGATGGQDRCESRKLGCYIV